MKFIAAAIVALFVLPTTASARGADAASVTAAAKRYVSANARRYSLDPSDTLVAAGPVRSNAGLKVVRLAQEHDGVPVVAGELVVTTNSAAKVVSVAGEASDADFGSSKPGLTKAAAIDRALASVSKHAGRQGLFADGAELKFLDPALLGSEAEAVAGDGLVWVVKVRSLLDAPLARDVTVDARSGAIGLQLPLRRDVLDRTVCDANSTSGELPCVSPVRSEGEGPSGILDADSAFTFLGDYHDLLSSHFGRDSIDGNGMPLVATVRYCEGFDCPYANAFWFDNQITLGEGYAVDDVVGHELTHGLNEQLFSPLYWFQTGAIDESFADVFGEVMDQTNATGSNLPELRWLVGEDTPGGAIRNMADPGAMLDPDSTFSDNYFSVYAGDDPGFQDNGGVHFNSAVPSRAVTLLADGGNLNGHNVAAIGVDKTLRLIYATALSKLSAGSDFADLAAGMKASCDELASGGVDGFTSTDCLSVDAAVAATGLDLDPIYASAPEAPICTTGAPTGDIASDDGESPGGLMQVDDTLGWIRTESSQHAGNGGFSRANQSSTVDDPLTSTPVVLPANAMLRFDHLFNFERDDDFFYDGGVVEFSVAGGPWQDIAGLPVINGYNGVLASGTGNPLGSRGAFSGTSNGYRSVRVDLGSLAGNSIRIRFRFVADESAEWALGWSVDDIRFYTCPPPPAQPAVVPPAPTPVKPSVKILKATVTRHNVRVAFRLANLPAGAKVQCRLDKRHWRACRSPKKYRKLKVGRHKVRVRVVSSLGTTSASKYFRIRR
ncbi:MAG: M4 family metallopeptidase [Thermoleophilaceae bacterium]|nr:M4 family metallopeptidase [Thermoleophilaceae bacterium]